MLDFEKTTPHPGMPLVQCRHVLRGSYPPFRQLWMWRAAEVDIIGDCRVKYVVCVKCWSALDDMAMPDAF